MNERLKKWENLGLLAETPETKKTFVANVFELLVSHLTYVYVEDDDGKFDRLIFPIFARIGNEIEFNIGICKNEMQYAIQNSTDNIEYRLIYEILHSNIFDTYWTNIIASTI